MVQFADTPVAKVTFHVDVQLDDVHPQLQGVVASAPAPAIVGESGGVAALLHAPRPEAPDEETKHFVRSLLDHEQIALTPGARTAASRTHAVEERDGRRELRRIRFT